MDSLPFGRYYILSRTKGRRPLTLFRYMTFFIVYRFPSPPTERADNNLVIHAINGGDLASYV